MSVRDEIFKRSKRRIKRVEIPGLDEPVWVQSLSERERSECEIAYRDNPVKFRAMLMVFALVDSDGDRIFDESELDDLLNLDSSFTAILNQEIEEHCLVGATTGDTVKN